MSQTVSRLGIVGSGTMGLGIAEIAALAGLDVVLHDADPAKASSSIATLGENLERRVKRGHFAAETATEARSRVRFSSDIHGLAGAQVVIEAIVEALEPKRSLMVALESVVAADCILATNTSSLSVTAIAAACARPERVAGMHFFNPVPAMKVVEIIGGARTAPSTAETLAALALQFGHRPVAATDSPGFIVNHLGRGYSTEALQMRGERIAPVATIDAILRDGAGFRMGPFELMDLTGLDVSHAVMESIHGQYYQEPRYRPSPIARQRVAAGLLGRKTSAGFYAYEQGKIVRPALPGADAQVGSVTIIPGMGAKHVVTLAATGGFSVLDDGDVILVPLIGEDATTAAMRLGLDASRIVGFDPLFGWDSHRTLVATPATSPAARALALTLLQVDGTAASIVEDSVGCVAQRTIALIVNIACDMLQQGIATAQDIDDAVKLGLGYPFGPLAWGDRIGAPLVLQILTSIYAITGDARYRPSHLLRRHAQLGMPLAGKVQAS